VDLREARRRERLPRELAEEFLRRRPQFLPHHATHILVGGDRRVVEQGREGAYVLLRQEQVEVGQVLSHLHVHASVGTEEFEEASGVPLVNAVRRVRRVFQRRELFFCDGELTCNVQHGLLLLTLFQRPFG